MEKKILKIKEKTLKVAMARSKKDRSTGLMHKTSLPKDEGMLFIFEKEKILSFWMKNTKIPLAIAFLDDKKTINEIKSLKPFDTTLVKSSKPAKYALEVNDGWFKDNNIAIGDQIQCDDSLDSKKIGIKIINLPPEADLLAKKIEDALVSMTLKLVRAKVGVDADLSNLNIDVDVEQ